MKQLELKLPAKSKAKKISAKKTVDKIKGRSVDEWKKWLKKELKTPIMNPTPNFAANPPTESCANGFMRLFLDMLNGKKLDIEKFNDLKIEFKFDRMMPFVGQNEFLNQTQYLISAIVEYHDKTKPPIPVSKALKIMDELWKFGKQIKYFRDDREQGFVKMVGEAVKNRRPISEKQIRWFMKIVAFNQANYLVW